MKRGYVIAIQMYAYGQMSLHFWSAKLRIFDSSIKHAEIYETDDNLDEILKEINKGRVRFVSDGTYLILPVYYEE